MPAVSIIIWHMGRAAANTGIMPMALVAVEQYLPRSQRIVDDSFAGRMLPIGAKFRSPPGAALDERSAHRPKRKEQSRNLGWTVVQEALHRRESCIVPKRD